MAEMKKLVPEELGDYEAFLKRYFPGEWQMKQARGEFTRKATRKVAEKKGQA
jgi:hypothetical protein